MDWIMTDYDKEKNTVALVANFRKCYRLKEVTGRPFIREEFPNNTGKSAYAVSQIVKHALDEKSQFGEQAQALFFGLRELDRSKIYENESVTERRAADVMSIKEDMASMITEFAKKYTIGDNYEVQGNYGYGWETVTTEENLTEAKKTMKVYDENDNAIHRLKKIRVLVNDPEFKEEKIVVKEKGGKQSSFEESMEWALGTLKKDDRELIEFRYGLKDGEQHTLRETADKFDMTEIDVKRKENFILRELRFQPNMVDLTPDDNGKPRSNGRSL